MSLKSMLASKHIIRLPNINEPFILRTDASDRGLGAILLQEYDQLLLPVRYASRKLSCRENNYSTMEKECLAVVCAENKFILYLFGKEFVLQTDHQPLEFLNESKFANSRIMRRAMFLQNFRIRIQAICGSDNLNWSRLPQQTCLTSCCKKFNFEVISFQEGDSVMD